MIAKPLEALEAHPAPVATATKSSSAGFPVEFGFAGTANSGALRQPQAQQELTSSALTSVTSSASTANPDTLWSDWPALGGPLRVSGESLLKREDLAVSPPARDRACWV